MKTRGHPFLALVLCLVLGSLGAYLLVRVPLDVVQASQLDSAPACAYGQQDGCIEQIDAVVVGVIFHSRASHELILQTDSGRVRVGMYQVRYAVLAGLQAGSHVLLYRWQGIYVYVDTLAGRLTTTANPHARLVPDMVEGGLITLGSVLGVGVTLRVLRRPRDPGMEMVPLGAG